MIGKFNDWLNEAGEPKRPPLYKVGDRVVATGDGVRVDTWNGWKHGWGKVYCEITSIEGKSGKWIYFMKMVAGYYNVYASNRGGSEKFSNKEVKAPQANVTAEGSEEIEKFIKAAKYKTDDVVAYILNTPQGELNRSGQIVGISIEDSLKNGKVYYAFKDLSNGVPESSIEEDITVDEAKENLIGEEIARLAKVEITEFKEKSIAYDVQAYDIKDNVSGIMFFRKPEDLDKFTGELQKLVDKYKDPVLQSTMNYGVPIDVKVTSNRSWRGGSIERKNLKNAAKNLKINIKELLDKFRGKLAGDKFGV
jgi:hypothetical protein